MSTVIEHISETMIFNELLPCVVRDTKKNISYHAASCSNTISHILTDKFGGVTGEMDNWFGSEDSIISVYDYIKEKNSHFTSNHPYLQDIYKKIFIIDSVFEYEDINDSDIYHSCTDEESVVNPEVIKMYFDYYWEDDKKEENLDIVIYNFNTEKRGNVKFTLIRDFTITYEDGVLGDIGTTWTYPDIFVEYELNN